MKAWKNFLENPNGFWMRRFFIKLNSEIAEKNAVLLLNTRKGYWIYKVFEHEESAHIQKIEIFSDRYVKKLLNFSMLKGKFIYLVDDTLSRGFSLLETYQVLSQVIDSRYICPIVFAINEDLNIDEKKEGARADEKEFWEKLKYFIQISESDIGEFCIEETLLLHKKGIPFVIDLPFLKEENNIKDYRMHFQVTMTEKQFNILQKGTEKWKFHFNSYIDNNRELLQGFIIQFQDKQFLKNTELFASDFVIEGTYIKHSDEKVSVIFIPFAILNSMNKQFLDELWDELLKNEYSPEIQSEPDYAKIPKMNNIIAKYRECVYVLSVCVAEEFKKYLKEVLGIILIYDYEIMKEHFTIHFIEAMKTLIGKIESGTYDIYEKLKNISRKTNICVFSDDNFINEVNKLAYKNNEKKAYNLIENVLIQKRDRFWEQKKNNTDSKNIFDEILCIEEIKQLLANHFVFQTAEVQRYALTKIIITMLNISTCSNKIRESSDGNCIFRGFRYGENSDLLIPFFNVYFYWAVLLFFRNVPKQNHRKRYEEFVVKLKRFFKDYGYLDKDITEEDFDMNRQYFKSVLQDGDRIYNKFYFLRTYMEDQEERRKMKAIEMFMSELY